MFWAGFSIGIFLGATIGMVVAGLLAAGGRNDDDTSWAKPHVDHAVMDEVKGTLKGQTLNNELSAASLSRNRLSRSTRPRIA